MPIDLDYLNALLDELNSSETDNMVNAMENVVKPPEKPEEKPVVAERPKRCQGAGCNAKLVLSDFACNCKGFYCTKHRYAEAHSCSFDYKAAANKLLEKNLVKVNGEKIQKI